MPSQTKVAADCLENEGKHWKPSNLINAISEAMLYLFVLNLLYRLVQSVPAILLIECKLADIFFALQSPGTNLTGRHPKCHNQGNRRLSKIFRVRVKLVLCFVVTHTFVAILPSFKSIILGTLIISK